MEEKEIALLIDNKIKEAKLENAEKRFSTLSILAGGLLVVFGIIIPFWQSFTSTKKIDDARSDMKLLLTELKDDPHPANYATFTVK